jgi:phosphate/sulfate permease
MTMAGAIIIALIFEAAGAIIFGGDVINTIKDGIIDPAQIRLSKNRHDRPIKFTQPQKNIAQT